MVYTSRYGNVKDIPQGNAVAGFFASPDIQNPEKQQNPLFVDSVTGRSLSVGQYRQLVPRAAAVFRDQFGITQGDVVGLFGPNHLYTPAIHHATLSLGAVLSPANVMYSSEELSHQLKMSKPKIVIVFDPLVKTAEDAAKLAQVQTQIVTFGQLFKLYEELLVAANAPEVQPVPVEGSKTHAYYCFSSGTSGLPKGVITTHFNIIANTLQMIQVGSPHFGPDISQSSVLPMSHIFGLNTGVWSGPYNARKTVIFPKFDLEDFVSKVVQHKIHQLTLVPPIVLALGKLPILDKYPEFGDIVQMIVSGAAPLSKETIQLLLNRCPKVKVAQGYGLTETTPVTHIGAVADYHNYDTNSIGWLVPGAEALLVDPATGEVVEGFEKRGELWLRGPMVMAGYLNNQQATDDCITKDKWFKTGDVAVVAKDGQFYIVDRIKELIKSNGHQVAPAELESILLSNPKVIDSAVIGVYNKDKTSENPRAYVVLEKGADPKEIVQWFNKRVAKHKRLWGGAVVIPQVPKSASGKILRNVLRERAPNDTAVVVGTELAAL